MSVVLITGSRSWSARGALETMLERALQQHGPELLLVHGGARGADRLAEDWCWRSNIQQQVFPAAWGEHHHEWCPGAWCKERDYCVAAGPRRNQQMVEYIEHLRSIGRQVRVLAFKSTFDHTLRKGGTEDMVKRAIDARFPVYLYDGAGWRHISPEEPELPF